MSSDKIELPNICNENWSASTQAQILEKAEEITTKWLSGTPEAALPNA